MALTEQDGSQGNAESTGKSSGSTSKSPEGDHGSKQPVRRSITGDIFFGGSKGRESPEPPPPPPPHHSVLPSSLFAPSSQNALTKCRKSSSPDRSTSSTPDRSAPSSPKQLQSQQLSPVWHSETLASRLQELKRLLLLHEQDLRVLQAENDQLRERLHIAREAPQAATEEADFGEAVLLAAGHAANGEALLAVGQTSPCKAGVEDQPEKQLNGASEQVCLAVQADDHNNDSGNSAESMPLQHETSKAIESLPPPTATFRKRRSSWRTGFRRVSTFFLMEGSPLERLVSDSRFESACGLIIMLNTFIIAVQLQFDGIQNGFEIGEGKYAENAESTWPGAKEVFHFFDIAFNVCFCLELLIRAAAMKWKSVFSKWMWFDTFIVVMGLLDLFGSGGGLGFDPTMIRVFRLVRLVRLLRIFKAMSHFDSLFLLIKAIQASWIALTWSFLLLGGVQIAVGLFLCQILQGHIENEDVDMASRQKVFRYFGTFTRTMISMFEITLSNWVPSCRLLIEDVSEWFILFYIVYRCMFCFAVIKVIAAVFITETNRVLESDDELTVMKSNRNHKAYINKLHHIFQSIDVDGNGSFSWEEFQNALIDPHTSSWLATLDFELHDLEKLFWLLDNGNGEIAIEDFVGKVSQLKGHAKTIDVLAMLKLAHRIDQRQRQHFRFLLPDGLLADCSAQPQKVHTPEVEKAPSVAGQACSLNANSLHL